VPSVQALATTRISISHPAGRAALLIKSNVLSNSVTRLWVQISMVRCFNREELE
jgi:hypothetical protein